MSPKSGRIQYIDAMRGFTMLLVVYSHVSYYCLGMQGANSFCYNDIFKLFRMPLFFFISGFVFFKRERRWNFDTLAEFFKKKITVQVLSPMIFMFLLALVEKKEYISMLIQDGKEGYWFTFALFEYFVIYIGLDIIFSIIRLSERFRGLCLIFLGIILFIFSSSLAKLNINQTIGGILCFNKMQYFLFFILGTRAKEYFQKFQVLLENNTFMTLATVGFVLCVLNKFNCYAGGVFFTISLILAGLFGIVLTFSFFRKHAIALNKSQPIGKTLQYIGRHTLDIYLIHYFFVRYNCTNVLPSFSETNTPLLEFMLSMVISFFVIAISLLVSAVIRQSRLLSMLLFGQK